MKASGQKATEAEVQQIIDEVDRDGDGTIDFEGTLIPHASSHISTNSVPEFVAMMTGRPVEKKAAPPAPVAAPVLTSTVPPASAPEVDSEAEYKSAWKEFDPSLNGSITAAQFRQAMAGLGETVTDGEVDEIINSVDGEDKISCESFVLLVRGVWVH